METWFLTIAAFMLGTAVGVLSVGFMVSYRRGDDREEIDFLTGRCACLEEENYRLQRQIDAMERDGKW